MTPAAAARTMPDPLNVHVANVWDETAQLLEEQNANAFRVHAYRNAANTVRSVVQLASVPGIGIKRQAIPIVTK